VLILLEAILDRGFFSDNNPDSVCTLLPELPSLGPVFSGFLSLHAAFRPCSILDPILCN